MKPAILRYARVVRSKNSGPYELTLDIMFKNRAAYGRFQRRRLVTPARIAALYGIPARDVLKLVWFPPALAVKITIRRFIPSGHPGESDIYGAQQHAPLLSLRC